jgi:hypothetical protein
LSYGVLTGTLIHKYERIHKKELNIQEKNVAARDLEDEHCGAEDRGTPSEWGGVGSTHRTNKNVTRYGLQSMEMKLECTMDNQPHQKAPLVKRKAESTADRRTSTKG